MLYKPYIDNKNADIEIFNIFNNFQEFKLIVKIVFQIKISIVYKNI